MKSFGELNGVTASSLLMIRRNAIDFLDLCNGSVDSLNIGSMADELRYMKCNMHKIKSILKSKTKFNVDSDNSSEMYKNKIFTALALVIKSRLDIEEEEEVDDGFGDLFAEEEEEENTELDDLFGEESSIEDFDVSGLNIAKSIKLDSCNAVEVLEKFTEEFEFIQNSLDILEGDINSLLDEFYVFNEQIKMFQARCKSSEDIPVNQAQRILNYLNSNSEDRLGVKDLINKSYNRISIFNLSFNEIDNVIKSFTEKDLFESNEIEEIKVSNYSQEISDLGDAVAYLIFKNMCDVMNNGSDLVSHLISMCDIKAETRSNKATVLGVPLNLCPLKFKGNNFKTFCNGLESDLRNIPNSSVSTYLEFLNYVIKSLNVLEKYATLVSRTKTDLELKDFKEFFKLRLNGNPESGNYPLYMQKFYREMYDRRLIPTKKEFLNKYGPDYSIAIEEYAESIFDKYKLFKLSESFSLQSYSELLSKTCGYEGSISYNDLIEVNKYLKDVYKIIPLSFKEFIQNKVIATSRTRETIDKSKYSDILFNLSLLIENFKSKLFLIENSFEDDTVII